MSDIDAAIDCEFAPVEQPPPEPCPKCGHDILYGFGLAGGGYGSYEFCDNEACDYFNKSHGLDAKEE